MTSRQPAFCMPVSRAVAVGLAALAFGAAATAAAQARAADFFVGADEVRIAWVYPGLRPTARAQVASVGPWARTDYAHFAGPAGHAEVMLKTAMPGPHVFHHPPGLRRQAESWNHLRGRIARWYSRRAMPGYATEVVYQRLALEDGRLCVVFSAEGEVIALDPQARPALVYLGYFCARRDDTLSAVEARRVIDALRLRRDDGNDRWGRAPPTRKDRGATEAARGSLKDAVGNARFPFRLATPYPENDRSFERP